MKLTAQLKTAGEWLAAKDAEIDRLSAALEDMTRKRDDYKADYLRRHKEAVDHLERALVAESALERAQEALRELVRLKDLKEKIDPVATAYERDYLSVKDRAEYETWLNDYKHGKPLAWDAARAALADGEQTHDKEG